MCMCLCHQRVVKKFKGDLKLWLQYIEFMQASKRKISLGQIYGKALALHPSCTSEKRTMTGRGGGGGGVSDI